MPKIEQYPAATLPAATTDIFVLGEFDSGTGMYTTKKIALSDLLAVGNAYGPPVGRSLSLATAYQATTPTKPAIVTVNLTSTANFSLSGGTTNSGDLLIGPTNAVASGTGTVIGKYSNSITGTIAVGLNQNSVMAVSYTIAVPIGYYFAIRQTQGNITMTSAFDQAVG